VGVTLVFRAELARSLDEQSHDDLNQTWAAVKAGLRIEGPQDHLIWFFDDHDSDENSMKARIKKVFMIEDPNGTITEASNIYQSLGFDSPQYVKKTLASNLPQWRVKTAGGVPYLIRSSYMLNEDGDRKFYVAIGESLAPDRKLLRSFNWLSLTLIPTVMILGIAAGWLVAGRSLKPVMDIAAAAKRISGSNLSMRIPERTAKDELEYLIETFNDMISRLEQSFIQVRQFSTDVSHELRTPITIIRGQLEVALFTAQTAEQYRDAIVMALGDVERLSQIVRALLLLSQAETGQVVLQLQPLDLRETARNITEQFEIPAEGADIHISFEAADGTCRGEFDRVQIERMLSNLISNAVKFTPPGGEIHVSVAPKGDQAEIIVSDTGQGIAPEHLPHIFDRFYRVRGKEDQASPEKGLGLGLSFVNWIVKAHQGTVDVKSTRGKGTAFTVCLPCRLKTGAPDVPENTSADLIKSV
jgi:heavy metal sensor kinase